MPSRPGKPRVPEGMTAARRCSHTRPHRGAPTTTHPRFPPPHDRIAGTPRQGRLRRRWRGRATARSLTRARPLTHTAAAGKQATARPAAATPTGHPSTPGNEPRTTQNRATSPLTRLRSFRDDLGFLGGRNWDRTSDPSPVRHGHAVRGCLSPGLLGSPNLSAPDCVGVSYRCQAAAARAPRCELPASRSMGSCMQRVPCSADTQPRSCRGSDRAPSQGCLTYHWTGDTTCRGRNTADRPG